MKPLPTLQSGPVDKVHPGPFRFDSLDELVEWGRTCYGPNTVHDVKFKDKRYVLHILEHGYHLEDPQRSLDLYPHG